jgi:hypothetical protein
MNPSRFDGFTPQEKNVIRDALKSLASTGTAEQPVQGGTLPPAMNAPKPVDEGKPMEQTKKDMAGAAPAVNATTSEGPPKWHDDPGHEDVDVSSSGAPSGGPKGTFKPTIDLDEEEKSLKAALKAIETYKAKKQESPQKWEELQEAFHAGRKAEEALRREAKKREEELAHLKEEMDQGVPGSYSATQQVQPQGSVTPAIPTAPKATAHKDEGISSTGTTDTMAQGNVQALTPSTISPTSSQAIGDPSALSEGGGVGGGPVPAGQAPPGGVIPTGVGGGPGAAPPMSEAYMEEDDEALKALRSVVGELAIKYFGKSFPNGVVEFRKEFDDVLNQVSQPKGGTENLTNVASPGQPPGKISAIPGQSGSSGVFRTDTGKSLDQDTAFEMARKNPASTLETEQDHPIGTYETPTHITTGGGYQPALLRNAPQSTFRGRRFEPNMSKSYMDYMGIKDADAAVEAKRTAKRSLPILKHLQANNSISEQDVAKLAKDGKLVDSLVKTVDEKEVDTALVKHLKRVYK